MYGQIYNSDGTPHGDNFKLSQNTYPRDSQFGYSSLMSVNVAPVSSDHQDGAKFIASWVSHTDEPGLGGLFVNLLMKMVPQFVIVQLE